MLIPPFSKSMRTFSHFKIPFILLDLCPGSKFRIELQLEFTFCHVTPQKPLFTRPVLQILLKRNLRKQLTFCDATTRSQPGGGVAKC